MAKRKVRNTASKDPVIKELEAIKKLLVLALLAQGLEQKLIAKALQIDPAQLSRMMPARKIKKALAK